MSSRLKKLIGFQIISPDKSEIWGLDKPNYHLVAHRENGEPIELVVSHPSLTGPGYLQRLDNHNQQSYAFTVSNFFTLFVRGQELYSLPKIELASTPFTKMAYSTPDESIELNWTEGKWALKGAGEDEKLNQNTVRQMTEALAVWQAGDYAASDTESGLSTPSYLITFTTESGTQSIKLGNESLHIKGRYAQLDDNPLILAMEEKDIQRIFLSKEDLLKEHSDAPATMNLTMPNLDQTPVAHGPDDGHNHPH